MSMVIRHQEIYRYTCCVNFVSQILFKLDATREEDLLSDYSLLEELGRRAEELAKEEAAAAKKKWNNQDGALKYKVHLAKLILQYSSMKNHFLFCPRPVPFPSSFNRLLSFPQVQTWA